MKARTPAEVGRLWFEEMWNRRDPAMVRELMAPDAEGIFEGGRTMKGPDDFLAMQQEFLAAIPGLRLEVVKLLADGDQVCVHWRASGRHDGVAFHLAATGRELTFQGVTWLTVREGRIVAGEDFWNMSGLMQNLAGR
jgi:steroid delta-isomerase-like uncharacterized protein